MFKQKRKETGLIVETRKPDAEPEADDSSAALEAAADDILSAISANDRKGLGSALRAAFQILESEPQEDNDSEDFHSQNIKAAQENE